MLEEECNRHESYINSIEIGDIIAYYCSKDKARSAKVKKTSKEGRVLLVETKYGMFDKVSFDDVLWVNRNRKWPRWVFNLLKGVPDGEGRQELDSCSEV